MKLYYTPNSPYARIARVAARDSGLTGRIVEIEAQTRVRDTSFFDVSPLARVPYLEDGAMRLADTREICGHFDRVTGTARWLPEEDDAARFLRHVAQGFLDGVAVWLRENARPDGQRSDPVMRYEAHRAGKVLAWLEPRWQGAGRWDYTALVLACAIDIARSRGMTRDWRERAPGLMRWAAQSAERPHMRACAPQPA